MLKNLLSGHSLEILEARIAPAALLPSTDDKFVRADFNGAVEVFEGQVLNTTGDANSGTYFLYMEKGNALVFFTDFNNNRQVDFNELTGISAGDGARMVIFVDVHGDIVTNLVETKTTIIGSNGQLTTKTTLTLSDSDNNAGNDSGTPGDGRVLLNNTIEKIELRSLRVTDIENQDSSPGVDARDVALRKAPSTYSIFGNIYAGKGFGAEDGGLIIDTTGGTNFGFDLIPTIGSIKTGTAASGQYFSFGVSRADDKSGTLMQFIPPRGQAGGDIIGVRPVHESMKYNLNGLYAGDGGIGARGGDIRNVLITGDDSGGYEIVAGNGGDGINGGQGGSILNFTDLGSQTSKVVIRSGDGGRGTGGNGGNGGGFSFETFNIRGDVSLQLGNGGDGFVRGGNGASLAKGNFSQPDFSTYTPANATGVTHLGSTINWDNEDPLLRYTPTIGSVQAVDFDRDGYGDFVFTTRGTSQVVVMFGNETGGFRTRVGADGFLEPDRYVLSGVRNPEALTVADLNGDGIMDIAVASSDAGSHAGVVVFLGQFEKKNNVETFTGFSDARFSALPQLDKIGDVISDYWGGPHQITSMVAGDFDGNGQPELALVVTQYTQRGSDASGITTSLSNPRQILLFLKPDVELDALTGKPTLTGQFYADFGSSGPGGTVLNPIFEIIGAEAEISESVPKVIIEASALTNTATNDVVFLGVVDADIVSRSVRTIGYTSNDTAPSVLGQYNLGSVDTDRELEEPNNPHKSGEVVTLLDFAVFDYDGEGGTGSDGIADLIVLSQSPNLYMVGVKGDGNGGGTQSSGGGGSLEDNAGNYLGDLGYQGIGAETSLNILAVDIDGDGAFDDVAIHYVGPQSQDYIAGFVYQEGPLPPNAAPNAAQATGAILKFSARAEGEVANYEGPSIFALRYSNSNDLTVPSFAVADSNGPSVIYFTEVLPDGEGNVLVQDGPSVSFAPTGLRIAAGNGGDSTVGNGGKGGSLGGGSSVRTYTITELDLDGNPIVRQISDLVGSLNFSFAGSLTLLAGNGGDGFNNGGHGGDISGVTSRQRANDDLYINTTLVTGSGGRGVAGRGGNGGDVKGSSTDGFYVVMLTGDGGQGNVGGNGGTVYGNGTRIYDADVSELLVTTGDGGAGASRAGSGGSILGFSPRLSLLDRPDVDWGSISFAAGNGGDSVSGRGGNGGSIKDSGPRDNAYLDGAVSLQAGNGGNGTRGGDGGSIKNFNVQLISLSNSPLSFSAVAGHGGGGSAGKGGAGGDVANITVPSRGLLGFNRLMAGNGGSSAAGAGGDGGDVTKISTGSVGGSIVVVSGAGGHGLTAGGKGGDVSKVDLSITGTSSFTKGLVIAGAGGDASAFIPNSNDPGLFQTEKAFGGKIGRGGHGGSIIGMTQSGNQEAHVDLIAGNGGSTLNYGTVDDRKFYVGNGGSIRNIKLAGNVGNMAADREGTPEDENIPIRSYNNIILGETIADYVEQNLRYSSDTLTDANGNVGAIVGIAGRMKAVAIDPINEPDVFTRLPATGAKNGSIIGMSVNNLMSAVAGSVDRIAAIQLVKGLVVTGTIGADKGSFADPEAPRIDPEPPNYSTGELNKGPGTVGANSRDYLQSDLNTLTTSGGPVPDGALIDGAVYALRTLDGRGNPIKLTGRVYTVL